MKRILIILITAFVGVSVVNQLKAQAKNKVIAVTAHKYLAGPGGDGDDLFPWPWGSECPFPWQEIRGQYVVRSQKPGPYSGHYLTISVSQKDSSDIEFLDIKEFDRNGALYASGQGFAQVNDRIVKGLLTNEDSGRTFTVMVRTYVKDKHSACTGKNLVTAITFCPLRGKKCQSQPNYLLERM